MLGKHDLLNEFGGNEPNKGFILKESKHKKIQTNKNLEIGKKRGKTPFLFLTFDNLFHGFSFLC